MYIVWTKDNYADQWVREDCEATVDVKDGVLSAQREGREWVVTRPVEVNIKVEIKEEQPDKPLSAKEKYRRGVQEPKQEETVETQEDRPEEDQDTGGPGNSQV